MTFEKEIYPRLVEYFHYPVIFRPKLKDFLEKCMNDRRQRLFNLEVLRETVDKIDFRFDFMGCMTRVIMDLLKKKLTLVILEKSLSYPTEPPRYPLPWIHRSEIKDDLSIIGFEVDAGRGSSKDYYEGRRQFNNFIDQE